MDNMQERIMLVAMLNDAEWDMAKAFMEKLIELRRRFVASSMEDGKKEKKESTNWNQSWWEAILMLYLLLWGTSNPDNAKETSDEQSGQDVQ